MAKRKLNYDRRAFNPPHTVRIEGAEAEIGDSRIHPPYVYTEEIVLAINVALATGRPLLVRGETGSGKSSLAYNAAHVLKRRVYEKVVTSRTQARDLLWEIDLLRRLHSAYQGESFDERFEPYVVPGPLWWAFDNESAEWRGSDPGAGGITPVRDPAENPRLERAVVLIDEIDKADPDVPNNLLVPLGSLRFQVEETGHRVKTDPENAPLVIITTNEERALPDAFLRRCVELKLSLPGRARLVEIGLAHFPKLGQDRIEQILVLLLGPPPKEEDETPLLSPAEFLDILRAVDKLKVRHDDPRDPAWQALSGITIWKHGRTPPGVGPS